MTRLAVARSFALAVALPLAASPASTLVTRAAASEMSHVFVPCVLSPEVDRIDLDGDVVSLPFPTSAFRGVAIDSRGVVYLADINSSVVAMNSSGTMVGKWLLPSYAVTLAVDRDDALWAVVGSGAGAVMKFSKDGGLELNLTGLSLPSGLAIDGQNRAWVADVATDKMLRISSTGEIERVIAAPSCPREIAVDRVGNVWVGAQCPQPRLLKFDSEGTAIGSFVVPGTILGGMVPDRDGDVWVSTPLTNSIHRYAPDGTIRASYAGIAGATSIGIDGEGMLWITGDNASLVTRFDPNAGTVMSTVRTGEGPRGRGDMTGFVRALFVDPEGDVDGDRFTNQREIDHGSNPFSSRSIPRPWLAGNVSLATGQPQDVLYVNDSAGLPERTISLTNWEPIVVFMDAPALAPAPVPFALYAMPGLAIQDTRPIDLPFGIGVSAFPTPLSGGEPQPIVLVNGFGARHGPAAGVPRLPGPTAPGLVRLFPRGFGRPMSVVLQGLIADPGSVGPGVSVTNAIGVIVR